MHLKGVNLGDDSSDDCGTVSGNVFGAADGSGEGWARWKGRGGRGVAPQELRDAAAQETTRLRPELRAASHCGRWQEAAVLHQGGLDLNDGDGDVQFEVKQADFEPPTLPPDLIRGHCVKQIEEVDGKQFGSTM